MSRHLISFFCFIIVLTGACNMLDAIEPVNVTIPSAKELLGKIKAGHPRLLLDEARIVELRKHIKTNATAKKYYEFLKEQGEEILAAAPSEYEIPDGKRLLFVSRKVVKRVYTLALLYHLEQDQKYVDRAWAELESAAGFKDWNPKHFLDTGEMTHGFAIGYDWLYHQWSDEQRVILRKAIVDLGLTPGLKSYRGEEDYGWFRKVSHNWNQVCNGGLGAGAIAIAEDEPAIAGEILHNGLDSFRKPMAVFAPDGACPEGPGYWRYASEYTCLYLAVLQSAMGTDYGLSQVQGFSNTGRFPVYMTSPINKVFNFADGGSNAVNAPHLYWLASMFDDPGLKYYQETRSDGHALDLLWYRPGAVSPGAAGWDRDAIFRGEAEVVTMRSAWDDPEATFIGMRGGRNPINHSHLDLGSFVIDALGERWAVDLGKENYNLPNFFAAWPGGARWTYFRNRAESHNVLVINPSEGEDQKVKTLAPFVKYEADERSPFAIIELSDVYDQQPGKVMRGIKMVGRKDVLVQDEISLDKASELYWFMHTQADIEIAEGGKAAVLKLNGKTMRVRLLPGSEGVFKVMEAQPLPTSPNPAGQNPNEGYRKLAIHLPQAKDLTIAVLFEVGKGKTRDLEIVPLVEW